MALSPSHSQLLHLLNSTSPLIPPPSSRLPPPLRQSWYYADKPHKLVLTSYADVADPYYNREFPTAWESIDEPGA